MQHTKHSSLSAKAKKPVATKKPKASWLTRIPGSQIWMMLTKPKKKALTGKVANSPDRRAKPRTGKQAAHKTSLVKSVHSKRSTRGGVSMSFFPTFTAMWNSLRG